MTGRAVLALVFAAGGLGATFGVRSWLHWRATGSTGYRGISGRPLSLPWWGGALFVGAVGLIVIAPVLVLVDLTQPMGALDGDAFAVIGLLLAAGSLVGVVVAQQGMGSSWRVGVDDSEHTGLVTSGVFRSVRNPIFTAMVLAVAGLALLIPTWVSLAALAALMTAVEIQVRVIEEPYLVRRHGQAYRSYAAQAGRFVPRLGLNLSASAAAVHPLDGVAAEAGGSVVR